MRNCLSESPVLWALLLALLTSSAVCASRPISTGSNPDEETYCNIEYNFCVHYPQGVFEEIDTQFTQLQQVMLFDSDADMSLKVEATFDYLDYNLRRIYKLRTRELAEAYPGLRELESTFSRNFMEATYLTDERRLYVITHRHNDRLVTLRMDAPAGMPAGRFEALKAQLYITTNT